MQGANTRETEEQGEYKRIYHNRIEKIRKWEAQRRDENRREATRREYKSRSYKIITKQSI